MAAPSTVSASRSSTANSGASAPPISRWACSSPDSVAAMVVMR